MIKTKNVNSKQFNFKTQRVSGEGQKDFAKLYAKYEKMGKPEGLNEQFEQSLVTAMVYLEVVEGIETSEVKFSKDITSDEAMAYFPKSGNKYIHYEYINGKKYLLEGDFTLYGGTYYEDVTFDRYDNIPKPNGTTADDSFALKTALTHLEISERFCTEKISLAE